MENLPKQHRAHDIFGSQWFNSEPISLNEGRGNVFLIDFWDLASIQSLRSLPYVRQWQEKYGDYGFVVIGVHAPIFPFAENPDLVERGLEKNSIVYPVVCDVGERMVNSYGVQTRPTKFLVDRDGYLRGVHEGGGGYEETERAIQALLGEAGIRGEMPDITPLKKEADATGAVLYKQTADIYLGYRRGTLGNVEGYFPETEMDYVDRETYLAGRIYADGRWLQERDFLRLGQSADRRGRLSTVYEGFDVHVVLNIPKGSEGVVEVQQDGGYLPKEISGADIVHSSDGGSMLHVTSPGLHHIVSNPEFGEHLLRLSTDSPDIEFYLLSFTSDVVPEFTPKN